MKLQTSHISTQIPMTYYEIGEGERKILLLHGFTHHARKMLMDCKNLIPKNYRMIVPNAPFPILRKETSLARVGHSWYFEDHLTGKTIIPYVNAEQILLQFIKNLRLDQSPLDIMGFSQGGFLAHSMATLLDNIQNIVLLSSSARLANRPLRSNVQILAINGEDDELVNFQRAKQSFVDIQELGFHVQFHGLPNVGHNLSPQGQKVQKLVRQFLEGSIQESRL